MGKMWLAHLEWLSKTPLNVSANLQTYCPRSFFCWFAMTVAAATAAAACCPGNTKPSVELEDEDAELEKSFNLSNH